MTAAEARRRFASARVARLATVGADGGPHLVPMAFALAGETVYSAVDAKPKRTRTLRRLANVAAESRVAILADHYEEDWNALWWVRADGRGRILDADEPEGRDALELLAGRYAQYRAAAPAGPVLAVDVDRWTGWSGRPGG